MNLSSRGVIRQFLQALPTGSAFGPRCPFGASRTSTAEAAGQHRLVQVDRRSCAFSLLEVILAIGLCTLGMVSAIGLLALVVRDAGELAAVDTTTRLVGAVEAELARVGFVEATRLLVDPGTPVEEATAWFADRDGSVLGDASRIAPHQRHFAIVLERDLALSPAGRDALAGFVAMQIRFEWPSRLRLGAGTRPDLRHVCRFPHVLLR